MLFEWIKKNKIEFLILLVILLVAAFLRLYKIEGYMTFLGDEGRDVLVVKRIIIDHKLTLLGPTASVGGFFLGPFYYYLMIPFLWAFRLNPVGPAVMVALFGIATVFLIYKTGKDFFNYKVGLLAAGLYAISPLVITYSHSSWNPNLMPFFCVLIIWLAWKIVTQDKPRWLFWLGVFFGLAIQLHYLTTFLMVIVGIYLFWFYRHFKDYFLAIAGFLVGWSPFIFFELRHSFPNFRTLYQFLLYGDETGLVVKNFAPTIADVGLRLFNRLVTNNQLILAWLTLILSLSFFFSAWLKSKSSKSKDFSTYSLLGLWLVIGIFLFGFYQKGIYDYYFGFMFPLPFLLTAFALEKIAQKRFGSWLAGGLILWLVGVNFKGVPFRYPPNRQLDQTKQIARLILEKAEGNPFNFALITGQNSDHAYRYFLEIAGAKPVTIENPQVDPERKTVTDRLLVVCEVADCQPLGHPLWEIAGFGRAEIVEQGDVSVHKIYKLKHWEGKDE